MKRLLFLINKIRKFLIPMSKTDLCRIEVKVLHVIVIRINYLLKQSSAVEGKIFVISIKRSSTGRPNKGVDKGISQKLLFKLTILPRLKSSFLATHDLKQVRQRSCELYGRCMNWLFDLLGYKTMSRIDGFLE